ncbi:DNA-dependent RNA polymerase auxiliary subunit epsilon [Peribacillus deserti]|uniref:DNA-directed RNA polymerase subunit epsilon n=1 Tax=Peribacillus deserti TaxID=673318 RepID=A0ABS2QIS7_9BACI|nr:DNA-directed RNA polymerase subunit epsilon [Peribacillus deserti]MBM7692438.1 DNA-dependent RNA polymerase auxiliary subunit epsilon [Peribacillus deserti]
MIFKVYYQETASEVPVREMTKTIYVEGESAREVIKKVSERKYNIEYVEKVSGNYLEYEKQNEDFNVLEL